VTEALPYTHGLDSLFDEPEEKQLMNKTINMKLNIEY